MNELLKINRDGEQPTVSGRDLHAALNIKTAYKDWFPRMCEYGICRRDGLQPAHF
ncbi:antA/AntB antirepressor family protein [Acetivibrio sp. MSJd-27]|uniref:antA/AntB antirepressor family protein n=1 Tax=Acetivibrio sp. MSJd-27 TaxID=2841523 RepID=UPI0020A1EB83|nr:antA/AntB antirepressor family protein [Acetivibrio sp. MSJd-27]